MAGRSLQLRHHLWQSKPGAERCRKAATDAAWCRHVASCGLHVTLRLKGYLQTAYNFHRWSRTSVLHCIIDCRLVSCWVVSLGLSACLFLMGLILQALAKLHLGILQDLCLSPSYALLQHLLCYDGNEQHATAIHFVAHDAIYNAHVHARACLLR